MIEDRCETLSPVERDLVSLISQTLFGGEKTVAVVTDPDRVLAEAEKQAVFPIAYQGLQELEGGSLSQNWQNTFRKHLAHNMEVINHHLLVHELLNDAQIPHTVMKGYASAAYYPTPELRTMGDVDLYVPKARMNEARDLFSENGYSAANLDHPLHWTFHKGREEIEVHWRPSGIPEASEGKILPLFEDLIDQSTEIRCEGYPLRVPSPFHHGLILLLHSANHLTAGGIGLRHLLDWLLFEGSFTEEQFRTLLEPTLREIGIWRFACMLTAIGVNHFGCPARTCCEDIPSYMTAALLRDIFDGGNFGVKNADRLNQSKFFRSSATRQIDGKSGFRHALGFLNQRARLRYPPAQRCPLLLPVGWAAVLRARAKAVRRGEQPKLRFRETLHRAKERESLYSNLRLFEPQTAQGD